MLATYDSLGAHYALTDWLGTKRMQISSTGTVEESCVSLPFGDSLNCFGTDANTQHFTDKERDAESGNDYFGARYYGSNVAGRFMTPDWASTPQTVPYANFSNPQSLNLYAYVWNNPLSNWDPNGHDTSSCNNESMVLGNILYTVCTVIGTPPPTPDLYLPPAPTLLPYIPLSPSQLSQQGPQQGAAGTPVNAAPAKSWWQKNWACFNNVGLPVLGNDLNPFSLGVGTAADAASRMSQASLEGAAAWSVQRSLTSPLKSSVVRAGVANAEALGRTSSLLTLVGIDVALWDAISAEHAGCQF